MFIGGIILTGGTGRRLGGADKASLELDGKPLLEHALDALSEMSQIVVVGDPVPTSRPVRFTREEPAGTGPAQGVLAGVRAFDTTPEQVVILAVDMPRVSPATIRRLMLDGGRDGSVLVDQDGRKQYLCGVYAVARLLKSAADQPRSMKALLKPLKLAKVVAISDEAKDVDTWQDLSDLTT